MDFADSLRDLANRAEKKIGRLTTEEATKTALVLPFIDALGYNVFDPMEVVPEFTADVGTKRGEKVDYAVLRGGSPIILFECKTASRDLNETHASQLYRYFSVTAARLGVLTNGIDYRFYSDLDAPNKMDERPFLEFNLFTLTDPIIAEIKKFAKQGFDIESILSTASDLKYTRGIQRILAEEWVNPSEEFVRVLAGRVYSGRMTHAAREQFADIVKRAFRDFLNARINERLQSAMADPPAVADSSENSNSDGDTAPPEDGQDGVIVTTEEEMEGFYIVRAIVGEAIDVRRVFMRDTLSYCGILIDDNNRKPLCRMHFNGTHRYLGLLDEEKKETRHALDDLVDLYKFAAQLRAAAQRYL